MITLAQAMPQPDDRSPIATGDLLAIDATAGRAQVTVGEGDPVWLPYWPGVYTNVTLVWVLMHRGVPVCVTAPAYAEAPEVVPPPPPPPPPVGTPSTQTVTVVVRPTWSGTYRTIRNAWDRWNADRYGGRSTLYQGNAFGSGELIGLATYGNQITALGALEITRVVVTTKVATGSGVVVLQGAPHGSKPGGGPSVSGETASGSTSVTLTAAMREALRTGTARSLASVGSSYRGTFGTARADGMALTVTYRRAA